MALPFFVAHILPLICLALPLPLPWCRLTFRFMRGQLVVPDWPTFNEHPTKWLDQLPSRPGVMPVGAAAEEEEDEGEQD